MSIEYLKLRCDMCNTYLGYFPWKSDKVDKSEISKISIQGVSQPILCLKCKDFWECIDPS